MSRFLHAVLRRPRADQQFAALGRFLVRQAHKRLVGGSLTVSWEGMRLTVAPHSPSAAAAYYFGRPDWWEFDFLERFLRRGDTAVDVGANAGVYSLFLAKLVGPEGLVIACEPDPDNARELRVNLHDNDLTHVRIVEAAVGDHCGMVGFLPGRRTQSRVAGAAEMVAGSARLTTLDALCEAHAPVFVKVDVEGFEDRVVRGARRLMRGGLPVVWQLEVDPTRGAQHAELAVELAAFGYRSFTWEPSRRRLEPCELDHPCGNNLLAIGDIERVTTRLAGAAAVR